MKRAVLALILVIFGFFVYYAAFRYMVIWPLLFPLLALVGVFYVITSVVTDGMIKKVRKDSFFYLRCSMIVKNGEELQGGALAVTPTELVFYARRSEKGGVKPVWSCFTEAVEGYTMKKVDDHHNGISLAVSGETGEIRFVSRRAAKMEKEFRAALGWPEENTTA